MSLSSLNVPKVEEKLAFLFDSGRVEDALMLLYQAVYLLCRRADLRGRYVHLKNLDDFVHKLSSHLLTSNVISFPFFKKSADDLVFNFRRPLIVGSEFYLHGGHTRVAERLNAEYDFKCDVILTDLYGKLQKNPGAFQALSNAFEFKTFCVLQSNTLLEKIVELNSYVNEIRPTEIFLLAHHEDVVSYVTFAASGLDIHYIHHCDHTPTLGATLNAFVHVDLTTELQGLCCNFLARRPRLRPLLTKDCGYLLKRARGTFNTICCGSPHKFSRDVPFGYGDLIGQTLKVTKGVHYHIGPLPEKLFSGILQALERNSIPRERFIQIPWVRSLAETLLTLDVGCLIGTYPEGGGTTALEAQSTGTPVIYFYDDNSPEIFLKFKSVYSTDSLAWSNLDEFLLALRSCMSDLPRYSHESRKFYEYYSMKL